jgi:linolenate 9R-lipoxygenase
MFSDAQEMLGSLFGDPRTVDIEPKFQTLISNVAKFFGKAAQIKGRRATHSFGIVAAGTLEVLPNLTIPSHRVFSSGNKFPVLLRHANIKGFPDDAIIDGRGATIRILNGAADAAIDSLDLADFLVDILMSTGRCFTFSNAATFSRWLELVGSPEDRAKMLLELPKFLPIFHEIVRNPDSYTKLHYYSETTYLFKSSECEPKDYYMRYRLINADRSADTGFIPIEDIHLPLDFLPRIADDFRPANYLRQDFRQRVMQGGVNYVLQIQLQPVSDDHAKNELAKDCTEAWDETEFPFQDVAQLTLNSVMPDEVAEQLELNAYHAPADLALILAHSIHETASINHVRSIVYEISANMRKYQPPSSELVDWGVENKPEPKDVFKYYGVAGKDIPRFDPNLALPPRVESKPRMVANFGLSVLPAREAAPGKLLGISGVLEIIQKLGSPAVMPANLTRCRPDKFSDAFFVERRLNGFNPGKMKPVKGQPWQYAIRYNCQKYVAKPAGIFPAMIEARFVLTEQTLTVHSIEYELKGSTVLSLPGQSDWEWAKRLFRSVEFVLQEAQSHLARTHLNVEQYAMPYYRNVVNSPIKLLLEPHFEGLLNVNKLGASIIFGDNGIIPQASALNAEQVEDLIVEEVSELNFHNWHPQQHVLPDVVANNLFDRAALAAWGAIEEYVAGFFAAQGEQIQRYWPEIVAMSEDLVAHSILDKKFGTLAIADVTELQKLCTYLIYHSSFLHSWLNYKQYEDGGDTDYATLGLWDSHDEDYNPSDVMQKQVQQVLSVWTLSQVRYNPIMENGNPVLKELLWRRRDEISPGLPLETMMTSIHI